MNQRQGLANTAQKYLSASSNIKSEFKCQNCHLQFLSAIELFNHTKKFCTGSGFDTLPGLNIKLKNPTHGMGKNASKRKFDDSLTNALEQIQKNKAFNPMEKQLKNDLMNFQRHQEDIRYAKPYAYQSRKSQQINDSNVNERKSRSLYISGNNQNVQKNNYGQKAYNNIYEHPNQSSRSKAYSFTSSYIQKFKQSSTYVSPPTEIPLHQKVKQYSLLDKSDMSIQRMPEQEKRQYVIRKILEIQQIQEGYKKNGGKNDQFIENTIKMKKFYQNLLERVNKQSESIFGGKISNKTRVSTPISKLQESGIMNESLARPEDGKASIIKSKISQIHQKSIAKRQNDVRKRFYTQVEENSKRKLDMNDILDQEMMKKIGQKTADRQNPIIVIPIQQPASNYPQQSHDTQMAMRYMETLSTIKDEQNRNFLQLIQRQNQEMKKMYETQLRNKQKEWSKNEKQMKTLQNKYQKLVDKIDRQRDRQQRRNNNLPVIVSDNNNKQNIFRTTKGKNRRNKTQYSYNENNGDDKQYREGHQQIYNLRQLNLQTEGYHGAQYQQLSNEEKLLMQMQKQERDELQLFAHLPKEIQQIKLNSIQELGEKRFQMEKQVIKQKLQKLKLSQEMRSFELDRKLLSEEMQSEKKKMVIHKLMKKKIKQMVKDEFLQNEQEYDYGYDDMEYESPQRQRLSRGIDQNV